MSNHSLDIYKKMSFILADGIHLSDILHFMGIENVYIYGAGEMGKLVLYDLSGSERVLAVFDQSAKKDASICICKKAQNGNKGLIYKYPLYHPDRIPNDENIILITPASMYAEITSNLENRGITRSRFLSFNLLLYYGMLYREYKQKEESSNYNFPKKQFLITGAQFKNKGSQAMLLTTVYELRKRFRDAVIWCCPNIYDKKDVNDAARYKLILLLDGIDKDSTLYELLPWLVGIIDVSGYALSSNKCVDSTNREMNYLRMACECQIPIYFMPQSFGPFDYDEEKLEEIIKLLSYAEVVYAREWKSYDLLVNKCRLTNVKHSNDLVLQNKSINTEYIYMDVEKKMEMNLQTTSNIALIPNIQNYKTGNPKDIKDIYEKIIIKLVDLEKNVYIIAHSNDEEICNDIYKKFVDNGNVHLFYKNFDCLEFAEFVKNFQYIIACRYHAIVQAYKKGIPCIVIGWAEKYKELLEIFGQNRYLFDVHSSIDIEDVYGAIEVMETSYKNEAQNIINTLSDVQKVNCFDILKK